MKLTRDQLKQILLEQREVLLKKPLGIEREVLKEIETKMKLPHVIVIREKKILITPVWKWLLQF